MADIAEIEAETVAAEEAVQAAAADAKPPRRCGSRGRPGGRPAQDRGGDAGQAAEAGRRQRPAAGARPRQGGVRLRAGAGRGAGRRPRCAGRAARRRCAGRCNAARRARSAACRRASSRWRRTSPVPPELARRLKQIGVVPRADGAAPAAIAQARPASGLGRRRPVALGRLRRRGAGRHRRGEPPAASAAGWGCSPSQEEVQRQAAETARARGGGRPPSASRRPRPRSAGCASCGATARAGSPQTRELLTAMERQARETEAKLAGVADAKERDAGGAGRGARAACRDRGGRAGARRHRAAGGRARRRPESRPPSCARASARPRPSSITLEREHRARAERQTAITAEMRALEHALRRRPPADRHARPAHRRGQARDRAAGRPAGDGRAAAPEAHDASSARPRPTARRQPMRWPRPTAPIARPRRPCAQAQGAVADEREAPRPRRGAGWKARARAAARRRARSATRWAARRRPAWRSPSCQPGAQLPALDDADSQLAALKADRERLGGVNLQADEDLTGLSAQFEGMNKEKVDVEAAIAKLRAGIAEINTEGESRLQARLRRGGRPLPQPVHHAVRRRRGQAADDRGGGPAGRRASRSSPSRPARSRPPCRCCRAASSRSPPWR